MQQLDLTVSFCVSFVSLVVRSVSLRPSKWCSSHLAAEGRHLMLLLSLRFAVPGPLPGVETPEEC